MNKGPQVLTDPERRGRVFELAVGAQLMQLPGELLYWREKNAEVDFVYRYHGSLYAIEVKSGRRKSAKGFDVFLKQFPDAHPVILSPDNFTLFSADPLKFLSLMTY
jgi:predicted AAA+ superfamily ATPase